jgi:hypothetical protein
MEKATKEVVNYRRGDIEHHCGICTMYRPPGSCISVLGVIKPADLCDYFKRDKENAVDGKRVRRQA